MSHPAPGEGRQIAVVVISLMTIANLRGLRESGNIFAVPTYVFVVLALGIVGIGALAFFSPQVLAASPPGRLPRSSTTRVGASRGSASQSE